MQKSYVVVAAAVFVLLATVVSAQGPGSMAGGPPFAAGPGGFQGPRSFGGQYGPGGFQQEYGPEFGQGFGGAYLGLSKEQIDKMRELRNRFYNETRDLRYELAQKRLEMKKLFTDPKADDATLLAKQKEMSVLRQKLQDKMAQMMIEGRKMLTPEQLQKLEQMGAGMGAMGFGMTGGGMMGRGEMGRGTW